jgi:hypothetical protein
MQRSEDFFIGGASTGATLTNLARLSAMPDVENV